jgi:hypothetical protein
MCVAPRIIDYGLHDRGIGIHFPEEARDLSVSHCSYAGSGAHRVSYALGTSGCAPRMKVPRHESGHLIPSEA